MALRPTQKRCEIAFMPDAQTRWTVRKLSLVFYPFAMAAVAINLFLLGLMWQAVGLPAISPHLAVWCSVPLGIPATWLLGKWVRGLMDEADARPHLSNK
ncbi:MAG: hypothetical protein ABJQ23_20490 [Shimia thalassica]|uniref:hypothetical protein n=1 Tax=Shimia thalassica TaxID=1715693 RepID=UPI003296B086